jgi:hypothetical protein
MLPSSTKGPGESRKLEGLAAGQRVMVSSDLFHFVMESLVGIQTGRNHLKSLFYWNMSI